MNQTLETLTHILEDTLKSEVANLSNDSNLINDFGLDSMALMYFVVQLEETFDITLPDDFFTLEKLSNVGTVVEIIEKLSKH